MSDRVRCNCARCRLRGLMWPAILISVGMLFLIGEYSSRFSFMDSWPVVLIVIGIVKVVEATASTEGHISSEPRPQ